MKKAIRSRFAKGVTLIELAISIAISGVLALTIVTILTETTRTNQILRMESESSKDLHSFFYVLEQYVSQLTQLVDCQCGSAAPFCRNPTLADNCPAAGPGVGCGAASHMLRFVYEDAMDPTQPAASANCLFSTLGGFFPGSTVQTLGCKREMELRYVPPVIENGAVPSTPGTLELYKIAPGAAERVAFLSNVTHFGCGMSENAAGTAFSNNEMNFRIEIKTRHSGVNTVADPDYESWHPASATFNKGQRRTHTAAISFRNLNVHGVHFGKIHLVHNCTRNGQPATNAVNCCSGYLNGAGLVCAAIANCSWNQGGAAPAPASAGNCCSLSFNGSGECI